MKRIRIGIIGDFRPASPSHIATNDAIRHAATELGVEAAIYWVPTVSLAGGVESLAIHDAIIASPGSPYASLAGALAGIRFARESGKPFLGACGGFQTALIEYARNVLGIAGADSEEHGGASPNLVIHQICMPAQKGPRELPGGNTMTLARGSLLHRIYARDDITEEFWCNFGVNPAYHAAFEQGDFRPVAFAADGSWRAVELSSHPFFVGTLFLPQHRSSPEHPHPVFTSWIRVAAGVPSEVFAAQ